MVTDKGKSERLAKCLGKRRLWEKVVNIITSFQQVKQNKHGNLFFVVTTRSR